MKITQEVPCSSCGQMVKFETGFWGSLFTVTLINEAIKNGVLFCSNCKNKEG